MIQRLMVANRGEIARRIFRTCAEMGIATVAVYEAGDEAHLDHADMAVLVGSYLSVDDLVRAARVAEAEAIHPGYGFLSESAAFAKATVDAGLLWIGPPAEAIEAMGSKVEAKKLMAAAGVPALSDADGQFPLLVKASAGGGGRGMRVVRAADALDRALAEARSESEAAFGDPTVFTEPYVEDARHIEVQVLADAHGRIWTLGERECSLQRRHQKVIEESPSPFVTPALREALCEAATRAAQAVGYVNAGTVEFLVDANGRFYFLEMNTRLQVEHPVTEAVTGLDLVRCQILIATGTPLGDQPPPAPVGHAIEARLYAEDPAHDWLPQSGTLRRFEFPPPPSPLRPNALRPDLLRPNALLPSPPGHFDSRAGATAGRADAARGAGLPAVTTAGASANAAGVTVPHGHATSDAAHAGAGGAAVAHGHATSDAAHAGAGGAAVAHGHATSDAAHADATDGAGLPVVSDVGTRVGAGTRDAGGAGLWLAPSMVGVRVDEGVDSGTHVGVRYDPMLAKVIAHAPTREEAAAKLAAALAGARIHGLRTNRDHLVRTLRHPEFLAGRTTTAFFERHDLSDSLDERPFRVAAARAVASLSRTAGWRNVRSQPRRKFGVEYEPQPDDRPDRIVQEIDGVRHVFHVAIYDDVVEVDSILGSLAVQRESRFPLPSAMELSRGSLIAPMPGIVVRIGVAEGDRVVAGQPILWLEAMKMEHQVVAPAAGVVAEILAAPGQQVEVGTVLARVEEAEDEARAGGADEPRVGGADDARAGGTGDDARVGGAEGSAGGGEAVGEGDVRAAGNG